MEKYNKNINTNSKYNAVLEQNKYKDGQTRLIDYSLLKFDPNLSILDEEIVLNLPQKYS